MERLEILKHNEELAQWLCRVYDVEIFKEFTKPEDEERHLEYSIGGKSFAREGTGSEFILLDDQTIGYWGTEGESGRLAENIQDFFELIINCPYWQDYARKEYYTDLEALPIIANKIRKEYVEYLKEEGIDFYKIQKYLADELNIKLYENIAEDVLLKFYKTTTRKPRLVTTYTEDDGSKCSEARTLLRD